MGFFKRKTALVGKVEWLIAGLGNPGSEYSANRHNIGWMVASVLCEKYKKPIMPFSNIYLQSSLRIESKQIMVALPTTFMNNSGEAVAKILKLYDIPVDRIVVIADEYNFPLGKVHLRSGGGDGGHNGIASVMVHLNSNDFLRLRCGIGNNFPSGGMSDYVLSDFEQNENEEKDIMINKAVESLETVVRLGKARGMSIVNSGELWKPGDEKIEKNGDSNQVVRL
ncbi:aminoacyl-tRNA hydrolase [Bacteroidota bacterium]